MDIDPKKVYEQDSDFREYARDCFAQLLVDGNDEVVKSLYAFYSIGMTREQVAQWMKINASFGDNS